MFNVGQKVNCNYYGSEVLEVLKEEDPFVLVKGKEWVDPIWENKVNMRLAQNPNVNTFVYRRVRALEICSICFENESVFKSEFLKAIQSDIMESLKRYIPDKIGCDDWDQVFLKVRRENGFPHLEILGEELKEWLWELSDPETEQELEEKRQQQNGAISEVCRLRKYQEELFTDILGDKAIFPEVTDSTRLYHIFSPKQYNLIFEKFGIKVTKDDYLCDILKVMSSF